LPSKDRQTQIQHEDITLVEAASQQGHLVNPNVSASLQVQQAGLEFLGLNVLEAGSDSSLQKADSTNIFEVIQEL